ncbi:DUF4238 domain-containing protein [Acidobacteria bacterium AH-259-D05]|nr:DUF4238 domain-containing protein [Acidobacteria bacterium AH-259-D05]
MPQYRKQHWFPVSYLKGFSVDPSEGRDSEVWRLDSNNHCKVKVGKECAASFFYSATAPRSAEAIFHPTENDIPSLVEKVDKQESLAKREYYGLMVIVFDLFLRNASLRNNTGLERVKAYELASTLFLNSEIGEVGDEIDNSNMLTFEELGEVLTRNWALKLFRTQFDELFSSDNPFPSVHSWRRTCVWNPTIEGQCWCRSL